MISCRHCGIGVMSKRETWALESGSFFVVNCSYCDRVEVLKEWYKMAQTGIVARVKQMNKDKLNALNALIKEYRVKNKPFCGACYNLDLEQGKLKQLDEYSKCFTKVREKEIVESRSYSPSYGKKISTLVDYKCSYGHGFTIEIPFVKPDGSQS